MLPSKRVWFIASFLLFGASAYASCDSVKVNCQTHKIEIDDGDEKAVDCGAGGSTPTTHGTVGGPHNGDIVKDGVEINAPGMGNDGGGKVFHTWEVNGKATDTQPTGQDTTQGCIAVDLETLNKLKTCKDAKLDVIGNGPGNHITGSGSSRQVQPSPSGVVY
jgi:hypothetical protein